MVEKDVNLFLKKITIISLYAIQQLVLLMKASVGHQINIYIRI
jgi:hypothetical protein